MAAQFSQGAVGHIPGSRRPGSFGAIKAGNDQRAGLARGSSAVATEGAGELKLEIAVAGWQLLESARQQRSKDKGKRKTAKGNEVRITKYEARIAAHYV